MKKFKKNNEGVESSRSKGFTLIEILVVIAIIAILAAIVLVAVNPAKRFQDARNSQRQANVEALLSAIQQNMVDNKGITTCTIATTAGDIKSSPTAPDTDLSTCLGSYLAVLPIDPQIGTWTSTTNYDAKYTVLINSTTKQVTVSAPQSTSDGMAEAISATR